MSDSSAINPSDLAKALQPVNATMNNQVPGVDDLQNRQAKMDDVSVIKNLITEGLKEEDDSLSNSKAPIKQNHQKNKRLRDPVPKIDNPTELLNPFVVTEDYVNRLGKEEYLYPNLIIRSHVVTIIAMPGGAKTTFLYYCVAPELAKKGLKVWYIDADSPASDHRRMKEVADHHGFNFINPDVNPGTSINSLIATLRDLAVAHTDLTGWVFIIDTLKKVADLMSKGSVKEFYQLARKLTNLGATVVLLGHANKYRDKENNLVFEGTGDVRADTDELIYLERTTNPNGGIDVTTVVDPDKGAKVRGIFNPISFHVSEEREITHYENALPVIDRTITATPKATDVDILDAAREYLISRGEPVVQNQLAQHTADKTGVGISRVRKVIVQNSEPRKSSSESGKQFTYTVGKKNAHYYEVTKWTQTTIF